MYVYTICVYDKYINIYTRIVYIYIYIMNAHLAFRGQQGRDTCRVKRLWGCLHLERSSDQHGRDQTNIDILSHGSFFVTYGLNEHGHIKPRDRLLSLIASSWARKVHRPFSKSPHSMATQSIQSQWRQIVPQHPTKAHSMRLTRL